MSNRPNIVYLHSHDTGRYVSPYGHHVRTPHMQQFAEQGVLFRQAFCANPTCSPSRAALLTGCYPHQNGMLGLAHRGFRLNDYKQHLVHTLKAAGYTSTLCGVQHVAGPNVGGPAVIGYDQVLELDNHHAGQVAPAACAFLREAGPSPFFLSVGFFETHRVFPDPDPADDPRYVRPPAIFPDTPETRADFAGYATMVNQLDDGIGQVLQAIDDAGLADNTLVIITTDHGIAFPAMKCSLTDHGMGVMLMMRGPETTGFHGGRVIDAMVSHLDIFPTLCDLLDIAPPAWLEGKSMRPLIQGQTDRLHDAVFATVNAHAAIEPKRAVRTERYKYIRRFDGRDRPVLPNCDRGESKSFWLEHGWNEQPVAERMLFDLVFDPMERNNLADDPRHAAVLAEMEQRLDAWMRRTDDPLCTGAMPWPERAVANPADGLDPDNHTTPIAEPARS